MATNDPYSTYVFGTSGFMPTEGTPAGAVHLTPQVSTAASGQQQYYYAPMTATSTYTVHMAELMRQQQEAQQRLMNQWMDMLRYGQAQTYTGWEEPKALEAPGLSAADQEELLEAMPF